MFSQDVWVRISFFFLELHYCTFKNAKRVLRIDPVREDELHAQQSIGNCSSILLSSYITLQRETVAFFGCLQSFQSIYSPHRSGQDSRCFVLYYPVSKEKKALKSSTSIVQCQSPLPHSHGSFMGRKVVPHTRKSEKQPPGQLFYKLDIQSPSDAAFSEDGCSSL